MMKKQFPFSLWHERTVMLLFSVKYISNWKVWESKWCQRVTNVLQFRAHHEAPPKHTDLCVFLLNWLSLKGSAPQLNVTTGLCLLSVPCWAWAVLPSANSSMWFEKIAIETCTVPRSSDSGTAQSQDIKELEYIYCHTQWCHEYRVTLCMNIEHVNFGSSLSVLPTRQTRVDIIIETIIYFFSKLPHCWAGLWFNS